jgi:transposase-like protein
MALTKALPGGFLMTFYNSRGESPHRSETAAPYASPVSCPTCRSSAIVTTAKSPDVESYWRCNECGEIWNDARNRGARPAQRPWR